MDFVVYTEYIFYSTDTPAPAMWLVEKKTISLAEELTFHELIDDKQGCPTSVRRANTLLSNKYQARDGTKSEHKSSLSAQIWHKSRAYFQF